MDWLDFSKYENHNSKFTAELSNKGGYIIFSNSGKGGNKKYFNLSLQSFLLCLKDILTNHKTFLGHESYVEKEWRDLGSEYYTDEAANAQCTVQTKPMFTTLSKIIMWANAPKHDSNNPEEMIPLEKGDIENAIEKLESLSDLFTPNIESSKYTLRNLDNITSTPFSIDFFIENLFMAGLVLSNKLVTRFASSLITKPFVILTGLSGSGKTKLAQAFAQWICQDESQYKIIPVGADWTNREPLLGYPNALNPKEYVKPDNDALELIIQANQHPNLPYFLILDEMNLSHVERYFADFLSVMESKEEIPLYAEGSVENGVPAKLKVPSNLFIIGTVNIDETTNMFSPKVLDRANTIEFRVTQSEMKDFLENMKEINMKALIAKGAGMANSFLELAANKSFASNDIENINSALVQFFSELKKTGAEFGYRSASEILRLINQLTVLDNKLTTSEKIDIAIIQKLLPKLHGSRRKLCPVLETLGKFCISGEVKIIKDVFENTNFDLNDPNVLYPLSLEKITRMYQGAVDNGFASFAEA